MKIESYQPSDYDFFLKMFHLSLYKPPGQEPFPFAIIHEPDLRKYYHDWGRAGDLAFLAREKTNRIGMIWSRMFSKEKPGYGFVDEATPEFGLAVVQEWRGKGVGSKLLTHLIEELKKGSTQRLSLSVSKGNLAKNLYDRFGFQEVGFDGDAYTMVKEF